MFEIIPLPPYNVCLTPEYLPVNDGYIIAFIFPDKAICKLTFNGDDIFPTGICKISEYAAFVPEQSEIVGELKIDYKFNYISSSFSIIFRIEKK